MRVVHGMKMVEVNVTRGQFAVCLDCARARPPVGMHRQETTVYSAKTACCHVCKRYAYQGAVFSQEVS